MEGHGLHRADHRHSTECRGGPVDELRGAEHRPAAVQEVRLAADAVRRPAGGPRHGDHQLHALLPLPAHALRRRRLHHLRGERERQSQDLPGGGHRADPGRPPGDHPRELVRPQHSTRLQRPLSGSQSEEGAGRVHLRGVGGRRPARSGRGSAVLLQQGKVGGLPGSGQVLQQRRRLRSQQELCLRRRMERGEGELDGGQRGWAVVFDSRGKENCKYQQINAYLLVCILVFYFGVRYRVFSWVIGRLFLCVQMSPGTGVEFLKSI